MRGRTAVAALGLAGLLAAAPGCGGGEGTGGTPAAKPDPGLAGFLPAAPAGWKRERADAAGKSGDGMECASADYKPEDKGEAKYVRRVEVAIGYFTAEAKKDPLGWLVKDLRQAKRRARAELRAPPGGEVFSALFTHGLPALGSFPAARPCMVQDRTVAGIDGVETVPLKAEHLLGLPVTREILVYVAVWGTPIREKEKYQFAGARRRVAGRFGETLDYAKLRAWQPGQ
jgi:hypothetical protein